jgi:hypothetical protein
MMTRRTRISIIALILLILLLLLSWVLYVLFAGKGEEVVEAVEGVQAVEEEKELIPVRPTVSDVELEEEKETRTQSSDVTSLTKTFVTRYGSYSSEAECGNLVDVLPLMTGRFAASTQTVIDDCEAPQEYYGVSTSIVTVDVDEKDEEAGSAHVTVMTQREEAIGSPQNINVRYQEIILSFVMEGGTWKIDSAIWQ